MRLCKCSEGNDIKLNYLIILKCYEITNLLFSLGYTRGGQGGKVERIYREVRGLAIPGGSEEILLDLGDRQASKLMPKL